MFPQAENQLLLWWRRYQEQGIEGLKSQSKWPKHTPSNGKPPIDKFFDLSSKTPFWDEAIEKYEPEKEHIQEQDFKAEERLRRLKLSL
jgi:hypothetical protein